MNNRFYRWTHTWVFYHILLWGSLVISYAFDSIDYASYNLKGYLFHLLVRNILLVSLTYFNLFYLVPHFLQKKKFLKYAILLFFSIAAFILIYNNYLFRFMPAFLRGNYEKTQSFQVATNFFTACRYIILSFFLKFIQDWFLQEKKLGQMKLDKLATELNFLRAQVNPHFLFNTLNNLYGLALKNSPKTPEIIMRLADMMDFMLYDAKEGEVPLQKDVENLINYVEIEKIRQGNNARISFTVTGKYNEHKIIPSLLLTLLENGFTHGVNKRTADAYLEAGLLIETASLEFTVTNNKADIASSIDHSHGIGLQNLRKRLDLFYPKKYELLITEKADTFTSFLKIELT